MFHKTGRELVAEHHFVDLEARMVNGNRRAFLSIFAGAEEILCENTYEDTQPAYNCPDCCYHRSRWENASHDLLDRGSLVERLLSHRTYRIAYGDASVILGGEGIP